MITDLYLPFILATAIMCLVPGPTYLFVIHYTLCYGKDAYKYTIPAVIAGDFCSVLLTFSGMAVLLKLFPSLFFLLKICAGLYIIYLGVQEFLKSKKNLKLEKKLKSDEDVANISIFKRIFIITTFNPKNIIFIATFFPQFIDPAIDLTLQYVFLGITFVFLGGLGAIFFSFVAKIINRCLKNDFYFRVNSVITSLILCLVGVVAVSMECYKCLI